MSDVEIIKLIIEDFERNYSLMEYETGRALSPPLKKSALLQVILYWYRMKDVAEKVTETEVRLVLPLQVTPQNRKYNMEGVVDLISTEDGTFMYDIKSLDREAIIGQLSQFSEQLGIYAHIWQNLNNRSVDGASVISTAVPKEVSDQLVSLDLNSESNVRAAFGQWDPVVEVNVKKPEVAAITKKFGDVVDKISNKEFNPPNVFKLKSKSNGQDRDFGSLVCRKCDGRYSCESYRDYMKGRDGKLADLISLIWSEEQDVEEYLDAASAVGE